MQDNRNEKTAAMISVIIPYYNSNADRHLEQLLERAILSVQSQFEDSSEYQIIVVDDGSPNPPSHISGKFGERITLIESVHGRPGAARNRGLEIATGDIVSFLDADDFYFPGTLKQCVEAMELSQADLFGFQFRICNGYSADDTEHFAQECGDRQQIHCSSPVSGNSYMISHTPFGSCCMYLISRELIESNHLRFVENIFMEDEEFPPRMLYYSKRFVISDAVVYAYCRRSNSVTTSDRNDERAESTLTVLKRLNGFRDSLPPDERAGINRKTAFVAMDHIRMTLRRNDWRTAIRKQTGALREIGLWPLRTSRYGWRYNLFAIVSRCMAGQILLRLYEKNTSL